MTKDVLISISGLQTEMFSMTNEEAIEVITPANYFYKNGKHYILYDEVAEGISGVTKNKIKITGNEKIEIVKSGTSNTHMEFERNKKNLTFYDTPFGQILLGIHTTDMRVSVEENDIAIEVEYGLDVNEEAFADCRIKMNIKGKNE